MSRGEFPEAVSLGVRAVGWSEAEVNAWIAERIALPRKVAA
jgi:prophage regulatory protein